jgi:hypothetical protein
MSLTARSRLSIDSDRSPSGATTQVAPARTRPEASVHGSHSGSRKAPAARHATDAPTAPSQDLLGETRGAIG